jgi:hypothetical protein
LLKHNGPGHHDPDLPQLHQDNDQALAVALAKIASETAEEDKWQRKHGKRKSLLVLARKQLSSGKEQNQLLEQVVVEGTKELRANMAVEASIHEQ